MPKTVTTLLNGYHRTLSEVRDLRRDVAETLRTLMPPKLFDLLCKGDVLNLEHMLDHGRTSTFPLPWYVLKSHDFHDSAAFLKALQELEKVWEGQIEVTTEETAEGIVVFTAIKGFLDP